MGGKGSGGKRLGAGRKPKTAEERALDGGSSHGRGRVLSHPSAPPAPPSRPQVPESQVVLDEADAPNDLTSDERKIWLRLAPEALAKGTLNKATELAFELMVRNIWLLRRYETSLKDAGGANHRGLIQRVDAELARFCLHGEGKPMLGPAEADVDPMEAKYLGGRSGSA